MQTVHYYRIPSLFIYPRWYAYCAQHPLKLNAPPSAAQSTTGKPTYPARHVTVPKSLTLVAPATATLKLLRTPLFASQFRDTQATAPASEPIPSGHASQASTGPWLLNRPAGHTSHTSAAPTQIPTPKHLLM